MLGHAGVRPPPASLCEVLKEAKQPEPAWCVEEEDGHHVDAALPGQGQLCEVHEQLIPRGAHILPQLQLGPMQEDHIEEESAGEHVESHSQYHPASRRCVPLIRSHSPGRLCSI
ncbi:hypothetical protein LOC498154, isoform CRA_a [Rattus norvegicus]|uniref:Uncharacterized protein LOC498154 n=1 Tax=Rattus norvegicus TaxID=10116 RepID=A6K1V8_RAT|nr:hypothetical protein LOC498154, isoform CRA_a [Rattus norvegicus]